MSRCLADRAIDHVVLERGEVAHTWRTERWDSLRLLTPNWQSRLPGFAYTGDDPDGYRTIPEVIAFIPAQQYRNPNQLDDGGVLVAGASASGTQIACELARSGRAVVLAVGEHIRAPRMYRGKD